MAETQTILTNTPLILSKPFSTTTQSQSQLENIIKNIRLDHINDVNQANKIIKKYEDIIDDQNDIIESLVEEREAAFKVEAHPVKPVEHQEVEERYKRLKTRLSNAGFKPRILFKEA